jgi:hypothetical protein
MAPLAECGDLGQGRAVAVHGVDRLDHDERAAVAFAREEALELLKPSVREGAHART